MRTFLGLNVFLALFGAAGCSDDPTEPPTPTFGVNMRVTDTVGAPVSGLVAKLHVVIPGAAPGLNKAASTVRYAVAERADITVVVYDLAGDTVATVVAGSQPAGMHSVVVSDDDHGNALLGTQILRYEMTASVADQEQFRDSKYMTLYTSFDREQRPVLGVTDSDGRIAFADQTEFPFLYNLGPQVRINENGFITGEFDFSETVVITLTDPQTDLSLDNEVVVGGGNNSFNFIWDESQATKNRGPRVSQQTTAPVRPDKTDPPPTEFRLFPNYPNPFN